MRYHVTHTTEYRYTEAVSLCHSVAHLAPRDTAVQICSRSHVTVEPPPAVVNQRRDYFGNAAYYFAIQAPHRTLRVTGESQVLITSPTSQALPSSLPWEEVRLWLGSDRSPQGLEARHYIFDSPHVAGGWYLADYASHSFTPGRPLLEAAMDLTRRIHTEFRYDTKVSSIATPIEQVMAMRSGVCQDFAHLQIGCLRSLGLAARYVSGYLAARADGSPRPIGADASHAWLSVFSPGAGWVDFDPTNNQVPTDRHITVAWGRDYGDVSPVKGVILGGGQHTIAVVVNVAPAMGREG